MPGVGDKLATFEEVKLVYDKLSASPLILDIPTSQWVATANVGNDYYITVQASNVTTDSILIPHYDKDTSELLVGGLWIVPAAGSFTIHTKMIPASAIKVLVHFVGSQGEANYQVLSDVYSTSQVDAMFPVPVSEGGTGGETAAEARSNLDVYGKSDFESSSTYCKLPDGTLFQWGTVSITRNAGSNTAAVTFPIPFATRPPYSNVSYDTSAPKTFITAFTGASESGMTAILYNAGDTISSSVLVRWFAVGRWK